MKISFLDLKSQYQSIKEEIDQAVTMVLEESTFIGGKPVTNFEKQFAHYIGSSHCITCGNGTDALELVLKAMALKAGDEVIVPACSWIATAGAVFSIGARPVFADVKPDTYTIDPEDTKRKISKRTKAIIPVHLYGLPAEMDKILAIAKQHHLQVIEDCAQAHGALYKGRKVGNWGDVATFSFYPSKNLGAYGDAGAILTTNDELAEKVRMIANQGQKEKHEHLIHGRNSRMDTLQAAILSVKLSYLDKWNDRRILHAKLYHKLLKDTSFILPSVPADSRHVFHLFVMQVKKREEMIRFLLQRGIATAIHYPLPLPFLQLFKDLGYQYEEFPVASSQKNNLLSLPMYPELTKDQIAYICEQLKAAESVL